MLVQFKVVTDGIDIGSTGLTGMVIHADADVDGVPDPTDVDCSGTEGDDSDDDESDNVDLVFSDESLRVTPNESAEPHTIGNGQQTFTIHNDGDEPVTIDTIVLSGDAGDFEIVDGATDDVTIASGDNHQIRVTTTDQASEESEAVLRIETSGGTIIERDLEA